MPPVGCCWLQFLRDAAPTRPAAASTGSNFSTAFGGITIGITHDVGSGLQNESIKHKITGSGRQALLTSILQSPCYRRQFFPFHDNVLGNLLLKFSLG
jgi:hypothetical protein